MVRNIRAFELATGYVDLEEDGVSKLSSFDAVKREVDESLWSSS